MPEITPRSEHLLKELYSLVFLGGHQASHQVTEPHGVRHRAKDLFQEGRVETGPAIRHQRRALGNLFLR